MATETQPPDGVLDSTNYSTLNLGDIDEDPDSPDGAWGTWDGDGNTSCRVSFPTPTGPPTTGTNLQEFRVLVRASAARTLGWSLELWENGSQVSVLGTGTTSSTTGEVLARAWDAVSLGTADGSLVECRLVQTSGGSGGGAAGIEVGAVEWNVTYSPNAVSGQSDGSATVTGTIGGSLPASGQSDGAATVSGTIIGLIDTAGQSDGAALVSGTVGGTGAIAGPSSGLASVSGVVIGLGPIAGQSDGIAAANGSIYQSPAVAGQADGIADGTGTLAGTGALSGQGDGVGSASGALSVLSLAGWSRGWAAVSGTVVKQYVSPRYEPPLYAVASSAITSSKSASALTTALSPSAVTKSRAYG